MTKKKDRFLFHWNNIKKKEERTKGDMAKIMRSGVREREGGQGFWKSET